MRRQLMAEQWDQFSRAVLAKDAPAIQRQEMRRAFYAGAQAIIMKIIASLAPGGEPTSEDLKIMSDLEIELSDFAESVKAGRA